MKILSVAWTIYDERLKDFMGNCTGGGLVIRNICEYLGRREESFLMIGKIVLPEIKIGNINIVKTNANPNMKNIKGSNRKYIEYMTDMFEEAVNEIKPDIINFHGYGEFAISCIKKVCQRRNLLYVVTDHLFISKQDAFGGYEESIRAAQILYNIRNIKIITVSNGMKNKILNDFIQIPKENIQTILNGTDFTPKKIESNYKEKYDIKDKMILLCVGTLLERKNQMQIVSAFLKLPLNIRNNLSVIFCGNDRLQGRLQKSIEERGLEKNLIYVGAVSSEEMKKYYSIANGLIMPSFAEGLSIAALETIAYGLPVIMFKDSECAEDLNDEKVVCFASNRSDEKLAEAIQNWYYTNWDYEYIKNFSKNFTMERMAQDYLEYYKMILQ